MLVVIFHAIMMETVFKMELANVKLAIVEQCVPIVGLLTKCLFEINAFF